jgi:GTP-binding protein
LIAQNGERGGKRRKHGASGADLVVRVPIGTMIIDEETSKPLGDLSKPGQLVVAKGGQGGFGNSHFTSSVRQTPRVAELGEPGDELNLTLEMKMVADVGLIGLPNVGKSTFLSVVSAARPKIADYEFTTLIPNLGVIERGTFGAERGFIAADIPGLIEGASQGKGLGDDFLRHIERTQVLVHFIDATHSNLREDYETIRKELKKYKGGLLNVNLVDLPEIVVVNKIDAISDVELRKKLDRVQAVVKSKIIPISAVAHKNIAAVIHETEKKLEKAKRQAETMDIDEVSEYKEFTLADVKDQNIMEVVKENDYFLLTGNRIERFAIRTDFANPYAVARFRDILKKMGADKELRRKGAVQGDRIKIKNKEFKF